MDNNVQRAAMSNVIQFPVKNYKPHVPQTEKELKAHAEAIRLKFIQQHAVERRRTKTLSCDRIFSINGS